MLHQVAAGVIDDDGVRYTVPAKLEGRERGALIARARFIDPNVDFDAFVVRLIDRRCRGAPVDAGDPAGVAMRQDIDRYAGLLFGRDGLDQR